MVFTLKENNESKLLSDADVMRQLSCSRPDSMPWMSELIDRLVTSTLSSEAARNVIAKACADRNVLWEGVFSGDVLEAVVFCVPLEWDTRHFSLPMARLECFALRGIFESGDELEGLIGRVTRKAVNAGFRHFSLSIESSFHYFTQCVNRSGFDLLNIKQTYVAEQRCPIREEGKTRVRACIESDLSSVIDVVRALDFPSRFSVDACLDKDRVSDLYVDWVKGMFRDNGQRKVLLVAERHDEVVAFGALAPVREKSGSSGQVVLGRSFLACSRKGIGAAYSVVGKGINEGLDYCSRVEFSTSLQNRAMIRILESHGCLMESQVSELRLYAR